MNGKRIAAVIGLAAIMGSVLCMVLGGAMPEKSEALMSMSGTCFLVGLIIFGVLVLRRKLAQEGAGTEAEGKPEE